MIYKLLPNLAPKWLTLSLKRADCADQDGLIVRIKAVLTLNTQTSEQTGNARTAIEWNVETP